MDDVISRQAAIDATWFEPSYTDPLNVLTEVRDRLKVLPSVERKKGKWIVVKRHEHYPSGKPYEQLRCPFCKRFDHNGDGNFCGYCGADMRGDKDGRFNKKTGCT